MRIWLDTPSQTGLWGFAPGATPPTVLEVLHDRDHPSRLVVAELKDGRARTALPACGEIASQPCRTDPLATP